jgi:hypothetical protein
VDQRDRQPLGHLEDDRLQGGAGRAHLDLDPSGLTRFATGRRRRAAMRASCSRSSTISSCSEGSAVRTCLGTALVDIAPFRARPPAADLQRLFFWAVLDSNQRPWD